MKSAMCKDDVHEGCGHRMIRPTGQVFKCDCHCHQPEPEPERAIAETVQALR